jgi:hypothetical protein
MQAYDQHLNMILGEVEETITTVEVDDETYEEIIKVSIIRKWCLTAICGKMCGCNAPMLITPAAEQWRALFYQILLLQ